MAARLTSSGAGGQPGRGDRRSHSLSKRSPSLPPLGLGERAEHSGTRQRKGQGKAIVRTGDVYVRRALMLALDTLIKRQPVLRTYCARCHRSKPAGVARMATARRALGILWATLHDQRATVPLFKPETAV